MPQYFFDVRNDGQTSNDAIGSTLAYDGEAEREAIMSLRDMAKSLIIKDGHGGLQINVKSETGRVLVEAKLVLSMQRKPGPETA